MTVTPVTQWPRYKFTPEQRAKAIRASVAKRKAKAQGRAELKAVQVLTQGKSDMPSKEAERTVARALADNGAKAKALLSVEAVNQAAKATDSEPGVFKILVDACDKLFGWSRQDAPACLIAVGLRGQIPQQVVSCGVQDEQDLNITSSVDPQTQVNPKRIN